MKFFSSLLFLLLGSAISLCAQSDPIRQLIADHPVVFLTDDPELIDWSLALQLTEQGSTVAVVTATEGLQFRVNSLDASFQPIRLIRAVLPSREQTRSLDSLARLIRTPSFPRTIFVPGTVSPWIDSMQARLRSTDSKLLQSAIYRPVDTLFGSETIVVSARQYARDHEDDYVLIASDFGLPELPEISSTPSYRFYQQVTTYVVPSFLSELRWRIDQYAKSTVPATPLTREIDSLLGWLGQSMPRPARIRAEHLLQARNRYRQLNGQITKSKELMTDRGVRGYLAMLDQQFGKAIQDELRVTMTATLQEEVTPVDTILVYRLVVSNDGALPIALQSIELTAGNSHRVLDNTGQQIPPHGQLIRQYALSDSISQSAGLILSARLLAAGEELYIESSRAREKSGSLQIAFDSPFLFVPPVARITDDRTAASHDWRIRIDKELGTSGKAKVLFEPPRGLFAGAYRQDIELEADLTRDWVTIPFSVTNLFELGPQTAMLQLQRGGKTIDIDSGRIRIAECRVDKEGSIGLVPDTSGLLEDILRMTPAAFEPLTDRTLTVGNLDAFRAIAIGSAANWRSPQIGFVRSRLESFLKNGGVIILFGQPSDWPENALPLPFHPQPLRMSGSQVLVRQSDHRLLTTPYVISTDILLKDGPRERYVQADLGGGSVIMSAPTGEALLTVAPYGSGKIIYCGLPLLEMISRLNIEAIHLLANLLNS